MHALVKINNALMRVYVDRIAAVGMGTRQDDIIRLDDCLFVKGVNLVMAHVTGQRLATEQGWVDFDCAVEKMHLGHCRQRAAQ